MLMVSQPCKVYLSLDVVNSHVQCIQGSVGKEDKGRKHVKPVVFPGGGCTCSW